MFSTVFKPFRSHKSLRVPDREYGNAMIYVLLAIALFGILTATLSGQNNDADGQDIDDEQIEFYASELLEYSAAAKSVIDQMLITGSTINDLDFIDPSSAGFDTPPHIHKVFHPSGGGLTYQPDLNDKIKSEVNTQPPAGVYIGHFNNVEWSTSTANDVMLTMYQIKEEICNKINQKLHNLTTMPAIWHFPEQEVLVSGSVTNHVSGSNVDLSLASCPDCEGHIQLCVQGQLGFYSFYTILAAR